MELAQARLVAAGLVEAMRPFCERVEVAGSIRRGKSDVKDVEIVAVPRWEARPDPTDLFGERTLRTNLLHEWAMESVGLWIKPGISENIPWSPKADGKYWRAMLPFGIKLDLFLAEPGNFGAIFLIRSGSADFSAAVMAHAKRVGKQCALGYFHVDELPVATPEEADVFQLLGLAYVPPEERTGPEAVRPRRA